MNIYMYSGTQNSTSSLRKVNFKSLRRENGAMLENHLMERFHLLIKVTVLSQLFPEI